MQGYSMKKFILVDPEKCIGCLTCSLACSFEHEDEFNLSLARIKPIWLQELARFIPFTCQQCEKPLCMEVCPRNAISKDPNSGLVVVNEDLCIGCFSCFYACPFGIPVISSFRRCMIKCDWCGGDPQCVKECPREALTFEECDESAIKKQKEASRRLLEYMEAGSG